VERERNDAHKSESECSVVSFSLQYIIIYEGSSVISH
jgi:hypothetical protein